MCDRVPLAVRAGFAYTALGEWPAYSRKGMYAALTAGGYGPEVGFVAKPASDGTNFGLLVMTPDRCVCSGVQPAARPLRARAWLGC